MDEVVEEVGVEEGEVVEEVVEVFSEVGLAPEAPHDHGVKEVGSHQVEQGQAVVGREDTVGQPPSAR